MKKRILATVSAFAYTTVVWWLGGVNFDTRGPERHIDCDGQSHDH